MKSDCSFLLNRIMNGLVVISPATNILGSVVAATRLDNRNVRFINESGTSTSSLLSFVMCSVNIPF